MKSIDGNTGPVTAGSFPDKKESHVEKNNKRLPDELPLSENQSSSIITRAIRKYIAESSYSSMYSKGEDWYKVDLTGTTSGIEYTQKLSKQNMSRLRNELGVLNAQEIDFLDIFLKTPFKATHATDINLKNENDTVSIFSRQKLVDKKIVFNTEHVGEGDLVQLANDDFVFFAIETGENIQKPSSRFGSNIYRVDIDKIILEQPVWLSLTDQLHPETPDLRKHISGLRESSYDMLIEKLYPIENYMFFGADIKPGIALSIINRVRMLPEDEQKELLAIQSQEGLNTLMNGLFRPEFKVPRHFFTSDAEAHAALPNLSLDMDRVDDMTYMLDMIAEEPKSIIFASKDLKKDRDFILAAININPDVIEYAEQFIKSDKDFVFTAVNRDPSLLKFASEELKNDKELVLAVVERGGELLQYAGEEARNDKKIVLAAVEDNGSALLYASKALKSDKEVVLAAVKNSGMALEHADSQFKSDKEVVLAAVENDGWVFNYHVKGELKQDKEVALALVKNHPGLFDSLDEDLQLDKEIAVAAILGDETVLWDIDSELLEDKGFILDLVSQNGTLLESIDDEWKSDKDVVIAAVRNNKEALQYADDELQEDEDVLAAL